MLEAIALSPRTDGALIRNGINSIEDLRNLSLDDLKMIPGIGISSISEISRALRSSNEEPASYTADRLRFLEASIRWHRLKADALEAELEMLRIEAGSVRGAKRQLARRA
ncbi:hypothetical protein FHR90_003374 [Endobacter medicaginis]|uniref:RNA polymerase alpha subunit C-terminal domain-containing protein n=1 Tax=Endobacter medicaginis TaxID=1181271 RepID=A0A850NTE1_9PROT|nr:DNA-directed RNA polymerase subunit alpha C-terminal domain-containing protein [Endobacter medicaginis]MBB3175518.1 hypothetical protein [Endobacter medicaginis]MCX5477157.1 helix-hairpin-helix domain-containing protein [Endobacter medicaginis]NVN30188.1 hypothetical protein [Endobacter medicaginis]